MEIQEPTKFAFGYFGSVPVITEVTSLQVHQAKKKGKKEEKASHRCSPLCASPRVLLQLVLVLGANHRRRRSPAWICQPRGGLMAARTLVGLAAVAAAPASIQRPKGGATAARFGGPSAIDVLN